MDKCKSNIVWKLGPFKVYGDHFYLIEEVHQVIAYESKNALFMENAFILVKRCQKCKKKNEMPNISSGELQELIKEFPMAFNPEILKVLRGK